MNKAITFDTMINGLKYHIQTLQAPSGDWIAGTKHNGKNYMASSKKSEEEAILKLVKLLENDK